MRERRITRPIKITVAATGVALALLLCLATLLISGPSSAARAAGLGCETTCHRPDLLPGQPAIYWASYSDYRARQLTVVVPFGNAGDSAAYNLLLTEVLAGGGVTPIDSFPLDIAGSLTCGQTGEITLHFAVPGEVDWYRLSARISAQDYCGNTYQYPVIRVSPTTPGGVSVFPADSIWNTPIDSLPVDPNSDAYIATMGPDTGFHPDFGSGLWEGAPMGIPYVEVSGGQAPVDISFEYVDESDPGPYPVPPDAPIEGGPDATGDRHVLVIDRDNSMLYEMYYAWPELGGSWWAVSGAVFDLDSHALRPDTWTSADAAGLPIFPGLVRYDEVARGEINHAIRFTAPETRRAYVWPARHFASDLTGGQYPPMGQRFRLRADFDITGYSPEVQVILKAMKKYGIILADNGAPWYLSGVPDDRWNNDDLHILDQVLGSDMEAVDVSSLKIDPDSAQARLP